MTKLYSWQEDEIKVAQAAKESLEGLAKGARLPKAVLNYIDLIKERNTEIEGLRKSLRRERNSWRAKIKKHDLEEMVAQYRRLIAIGGEWE